MHLPRPPKTAAPAATGSGSLDKTVREIARAEARTEIDAHVRQGTRRR